MDHVINRLSLNKIDFVIHIGTHGKFAIASDASTSSNSSIDNAFNNKRIVVAGNLYSILAGECLWPVHNNSHNAIDDTISINYRAVMNSVRGDLINSC